MNVTLEEMLEWLRNATPQHDTETCDCAICFMINAVVGTAKIIEEEKEQRS